MHVPPKVALFHRGLDQCVGSAKMTELIEIMCRRLTQAGSKNNALVGWAHYCNLVNTIERSAMPAKRQQRVRVPQHIHMQWRLSLYSLLTHLSVTLNSRHKIIPCNAAFC